MYRSPNMAALTDPMDAKCAPLFHHWSTCSTTVQLKTFYLPNLAASLGDCYHPLVMPDYSIGLDLGGTNLRAAAIDRAGKMLDDISGATDFKAGRDAVLDDISSAIAQLREKHGAEGLAGIGIGVPGFIRMKEGIITNCNNLPFLENVPIRDEISRRLQSFVILENDANAAALGEKWMGAGQGVDDLVLLTLGTGIGGSIISGGRILRGVVGMAVEVVQITAVTNVNACGCGYQ